MSVRCSEFLQKTKCLHHRPNHPVEESSYILPNPLPIAPKRAKPPALPPSTPARKRPLDLEAEDMPPKKRTKNGAISDANLTSPSKKRRLEEDGLLIVDDPTEDINVEDAIEGGPQLITIDD